LSINFINWIPLETASINKDSNIENAFNFIAHLMELKKNATMEFFKNFTKTNTKNHLKFLNSSVEAECCYLINNNKYFYNIYENPSVTLLLATLEVQYAALTESAWNQINSFLVSSQGFPPLDNFHNMPSIEDMKKENPFEDMRCVIRSFYIIFNIAEIDDRFTYFISDHTSLSKHFNLSTEAAVYYI